jgi:TPR repeat protein
LGSASAANILSEWHFEGIVLRFDGELPISRLESKARNGEVEAQVALGRLLASGIQGTQDIASAYPWFEMAAGAGAAYAQAWMGDCCRMGLVGPPDPVAADSWYRMAAAQDHVGAQIMLAEALSSSDSSTEVDFYEMFALWLAAATAGNPYAQRNAAQCYLAGRGCEADPTAAARWFEAAADQGDAEAAFQLGDCYVKGLGVEESPETARHWLEKASALGRADAICAPTK